jgi:hypothetical protein
MKEWVGLPADRHIADCLTEMKAGREVQGHTWGMFIVFSTASHNVHSEVGTPPVLLGTH